MLGLTGSVTKDGERRIGYSQKICRPFGENSKKNPLNWNSTPRNLACATDETKLWLSPSTKQRRNSCSRLPLVYQDLSTYRDWPIKKAIVDLPIRLKGNSKRNSVNSLSPLGAQTKDFGAASQTLLTGVKLRLQRRLQEIHC